MVLNKPVSGNRKMSQREIDVNKKKLLSMRMVPTSQSHFDSLHDFNMVYIEYVEFFNNFELYVKPEANYGKREFLQLIYPLHKNINMCFDAYVECIPSRYCKYGVIKSREYIYTGNGFRISKKFYSSIKELQKAAEIFKLAYRSQNFSEQLAEKLSRLVNEIDILISCIKCDKNIPTKICDKHGNFILPRLRTNRNIEKRKIWYHNVEHFKSIFCRLPRWKELWNEKPIYLEKEKRWIKPKKYYANSYQLPRRTHSRYLREYKKGTILKLYSE